MEGAGCWHGQGVLVSTGTGVGRDRARAISIENVSQLGADFVHG